MDEKGREGRRALSRDGNRRYFLSPLSPLSAFSPLPPLPPFSSAAGAAASGAFCLTVGTLARFYKIQPQEVLVVHDELDFPPGTAKLKLGGGVAGHNGLKDVAAQLGTHGFWRLRIGIGHPGNKDIVADYVLTPPPAAEREAIEAALERCMEASGLLLDGDMEAAMLKLHTKS